MYEVDWLPGGILHARLTGFWDDRMVTSFSRDVHALLRRKPQPVFSGLCDISGLQVQPGDVVLRLGQLLGEIRASGMRRGATIVTSALLKMQADRVVDASRATFFSSVAEGLAWLEEMDALDRAA